MIAADPISNIALTPEKKPRRERYLRQYLREYEAFIPDNKGETAVPTATVIFESFAIVTRVEFTLDGTTMYHLHGWKAHHDQVCQALGLDHLIYEVTPSQKNSQATLKGP